MIPAVRSPAFPAMSDREIDAVRMVEARALCLPQMAISTSHVFHAGIYARTIRIPAGVRLTGALIKIPTLLILSGHASVFVGGEGEAAIELIGYHVIPASAGRKQLFIAHADTDLTMLFATSAKTVEQAENEFTDEAHLLFSRQHVDTDTTIVTGE